MPDTSERVRLAQVVRICEVATFSAASPLAAVKVRIYNKTRKISSLPGSEGQGSSAWGQAQPLGDGLTRLLQSRFSAIQLYFSCFRNHDF